MQQIPSQTNTLANRIRATIAWTTFSLLFTLCLPAHSTATPRPQPRIERVEYVKACSNTADTVRLSFLDVGQGDATLISCPQGSTHILIDAGDSSEVYPNASEKFLRALFGRIKAPSANAQEESRVPTITLAIATHAHPDHIFGFTSLLKANASNTLKLKKFIDSGYDSLDTEIDNEIRHSLEEQDIPYLKLSTPSVTFDICGALLPSAKLTLEQPPKSADAELGCPENLNDCSISARLSVHGLEVLLLADRTYRWEKRALLTDSPLLQAPISILKVGHHGASSASKELVKKVSPLLSIISAGRPKTGSNAKRRYPRTESISVLEKNSAKSIAGKVLPQYDIAAYGCELEKPHCRWTNYSVPTTLLATAQLGTIDILLQKDSLCVSAEHLSIGINLFFTHETLASDLE